MVVSSSRAVAVYRPVYRPVVPLQSYSTDVQLQSEPRVSHAVLADSHARPRIALRACMYAESMRGCACGKRRLLLPNSPTASCTRVCVCQEVTGACATTRTHATHTHTHTLFGCFKRRIFYTITYNGSLWHPSLPAATAAATRGVDSGTWTPLPCTATTAIATCSFTAYATIAAVNAAVSAATRSTTRSECISAVPIIGRNVRGRGRLRQR